MEFGKKKVKTKMKKKNNKVQELAQKAQDKKEMVARNDLIVLNRDRDFTFRRGAGGGGGGGVDY